MTLDIKGLKLCKKGLKLQKIFSKEEEQQICNEYFSEEKPSTTILAKKWTCVPETIRKIIIRNNYKLRTHSEAISGKNHPFYNKPRSEETKKKISEKNKGKPKSEEQKRKQSITMKSKNKKHTEEAKQKMRDKKLGKKRPPFSEEWKRNMSISRKGRKAWNKNLTRKTDERVEKMSKKLENKHPSIITKKKMHKNHSPFSNETKEKMSKSALIRIKTQHGPYKDTAPELKMKEILNELNIPFEHQFRLGNHNFDFYILNTNVLIEVDGDWYHGNPKKYSVLNKMQLEQKEKDNRCNEIAINNNFILLRFWEDDILNNIENIKNILGKIL